MLQGVEAVGMPSTNRGSGRYLTVDCHHHCPLSVSSFIIIIQLLSSEFNAYRSIGRT